MTTTTNYGLKKPSYTDPADVNDLNYNSDTIDSALHSLDTDKEALTNKSQDVATDAASTDKYPSTKAVADYVAALHSKLIQIVDSLTGKSKYTPAEIWSMWSEGYGLKLNQYTVVAVGVDSILSPTEAELILLTPLPKTRKAIVSADKSYVVGSAAADFSEVNFTTELNTKLTGIESGAEVNDVTDVQDKSGNSLVTNKIAKIQTVPTPTAADEGKAVVVDSNGDYILDTVGGGGTASDITYDNTSSGLAATDVQDAIDEITTDLTNFQDKSYLVTSLTSACTDTQYPSAKVVYDTISNLPAMPSGTNNGDILVWNGSAWVAQAKPSRLPAGYQEVEYIESTGTQYIDTGVGINQNSKWMVDVSFDSAHNDVFQCMGAAIDGGASSTLRVNSSTSGNNFEVQLGTIVQTNTNRNNRTRVLLDNNTAKVYCDEILNVTGTVATTSKSNAYLFARNRPGSMANCYAKLYRAKYWELVNSVWTTVAEFIPCYRVSDNEIGLYDIANNAFLVNNGTGTFTKGADV